MQTHPKRSSLKSNLKVPIPKCCLLQHFHKQETGICAKISRKLKLLLSLKVVRGNTSPQKFITLSEYFVLLSRRNVRKPSNTPHTLLVLLIPLWFFKTQTAILHPVIELPITDKPRANISVV